MVDTPRLTVPAKPPWLVIVMVELAFEPDWKPVVEGLAEMLKSSTLTMTWRE